MYIFSGRIRTSRISGQTWWKWWHGAIFYELDIQSFNKFECCFLFFGHMFLLCSSLIVVNIIGLLLLRNYQWQLLHLFLYTKSKNIIMVGDYKIKCLLHFREFGELKVYKVIVAKRVCRFGTFLPNNCECMHEYPIHQLNSNCRWNICCLSMGRLNKSFQKLSKSFKKIIQFDLSLLLLSYCSI